MQRQRRNKHAKQISGSAPEWLVILQRQFEGGWVEGTNEPYLAPRVQSSNHASAEYSPNYFSSKPWIYLPHVTVHNDLAWLPSQTGHARRGARTGGQATVKNHGLLRLLGRAAEQHDVVRQDQGEVAHTQLH